MTNKTPADKIMYETKANEACLDFSDLDSLVSLARSSEDHEAYRMVVASEHFRVGLVVNAAADAPISYRIEVLLQILANDTQPRLADLERMSDVLEDLSKRGYSLSHHDSCWVLCEREATVDDVEKECMTVVMIVQSKKCVET